MRFLLSFRYVFIGIAFAFLLTGCDREPAPERIETVATDPTSPPIASHTVSDLRICEANPGWVSNPTPPDEIPDRGEHFCGFYQFVWEWFLYLMSPSSTQSELRNFQITSDYPVLQMGNDSCSASDNAPVFYVRTVKGKEDISGFVLPERIGQAGGNATIYDQDNNVIFYSVSFGRSLCDASSSGNLPTDTIELKLAWKVIEASDKDEYLWIEADVIPSEEGQPAANETLGLIGFHLVLATVDHPAMIWASFEHKNNAPNCINPEESPTGDWSFLSSTCQACLSNPDDECLESCALNQARNHKALTGESSEICRIFPEGSAPTDPGAEENIADVMALNNQLVGPEGLLTRLPNDDPMAVISNYFNIGALWLNDPSEPATIDNQRGSLQLANPVIETIFQGSIQLNNDEMEAHSEGAVNCFGCHQYTPNETATSGLSHIINHIRHQQN